MNGIERSGKDIAAAILGQKVPVTLDKSTKTHSANDVAKHRVLHLALQFRRIVLQDAVMFINTGAGDTPLLQDAVFHTLEFLAWKDEMLSRMTKITKALRKFEDVTPDMVRMLETQNKDILAQFQHIRQQHEPESLWFLRQEEVLKKIYENLCLMVKASGTNFCDGTNTGVKGG